ncbi:speckle-type POZ protein [Nephila pilipes]|uniref:Speckle-type POZ protein n=1 Tax=Nephila pilipes TaxID=299642 RepID=A0A8X6MGW1_NEPPI|nr:speckle-type POZ protein [Nephila pilipes]GFU60202.1 speckle-type POZ protein [Nephila pilipes]
MNENGFYDTIYYSGPNCFLYTWTVQDFGKIKRSMNGSQILLPDCIKTEFTLCKLLDCFRLSMKSPCNTLTCNVTFFNCIGVALFSRSLKKSAERVEMEYYYCMLMAFKEEAYKELQNLPKDILVIVCDISQSEEQTKQFALRKGSSRNGYLDYLQMLAADLRNATEDFSREKLSLCVGNEIEFINKAVLCSRSRVFAKMFECDMREKKETVVTITDVSMHVLKSLVSFLYTGIVPDRDCSFLCELYSAADKYDIPDLREECHRQLVSKFTPDNVCDIMEMSNKYSDEHLKFSAMLYIGSNLKSVVTTESWKDLMHYDPKVALDVIDFLYLVIDR